jgi:hypothetical protein
MQVKLPTFLAMTSPPFPLEFGLDSFGELALDGTGQPLSPAQTVRLLVDEGVLADEVGLDFYNIGEHYKPGVVDTAGHVILAAIAAKTQRIRVGTSVLVLSTYSGPHCQHMNLALSKLA